MTESTLTKLILTGMLLAAFTVERVTSCARAVDAEMAKQNAQYSAEYRAQEKAESDACIASGGVPIRSAWDGRMKKCDPKPR